MATTAGPIPSPTQRYRVPELLQDIRLLDLLELSGTTVQASQLLNLSQPTVSRRYRTLAQDFGLERRPRQLQCCRYGASEAMRWLRMGCRAHRLEAGVARIGTDLFHQPLLTGMDWLLPVPTRFRTIQSWADLVREGVLDGALVSGLELQTAGTAELGGLQWVELGRTSLALAMGQRHGDTCSPSMPPVLVPNRGVAPGLQRALQSQGLDLQSVGLSCTTAETWLNHLQARPVAMPLLTWPADMASWSGSLNRLPLPRPLSCAVGLLLPEGPQLQGLLGRMLEQWMQELAGAGAGS